MSSVLTVKFPPFELHPGQRDFVSSLAQENAYVGGFGAGKTTALISRAVLKAHQFPGNKILITRKTYRSLNDTTRASFYEEVPPDLIAGEDRSEDLTYLHAKGGALSTIFWRSFEDSPKDWQKFRSMDFGDIFIDEASEAPSGLVDILIGRLRTKAVPLRSINFISNPIPKDHWLYKRFNDPNVDTNRRRWFLGTTYENRANLPPGYIEDMEEAYKDRPEMIDILLKGQAGRIPDGLPVFRHYRRSNGGVVWHYRPNLEPTEGQPILRGWDFGAVRPAVIWMQWGARKRVFREKMGHNTNTREFGRYIKELSTEMFPGFAFRDFCDPQGWAVNPSDGGSDVKELHGIDIFPVRIKKTNPGWRANLLDEMLLRTVNTGEGVEPEFQLDQSCTILDGAFIGGYKRPEPIPEEEVDDEPVKDGYYEHPIDALGFVMVGRSGMGQSSRSSSEATRRSNQKQRRVYAC